jgi:hypothetical protein
MKRVDGLLLPDGMDPTEEIAFLDLQRRLRGIIAAQFALPADALLPSGNFYKRREVDTELECSDEVDTELEE